MARVLVIGGGPGGLTAAASAASMGHEVRLLEKGRIGENIRCAEGFFDVLKKLGKPGAGVRFKVEKLIAKALATYEIDVSDLNLWMIDRREWQEDLARIARDKGAVIEENSPVSPKDLEGLMRDYDYIIDASGAPPVTARAYGFADFYKQNCARTVQYVMEGDFSYLGNNLKVGLLPGLYGYYWIFPKDGHTANVGVGSFGGEPLPLWNRLRDVLEMEGLAGYAIKRKLGGICPIRMAPRLVYDNILLVGDAAGLTSPLHGGGIDMAVLSGMEAVRSLSSGGTDYEKNLRKLLSPRLTIEAMAAGVWKKKGFEEMDELIGKLVKTGLYRPFLNPNQFNSFTAGLIAKILRVENPAV
ncbi:NAD(P)/FAD-dependent oxidoreductase [Thermosediminibacter oceani]|uniref:Fumarate reductase/succinate dehydrogenase flavoprotein domain protein n=1 Tax=Thermosediminibacter oceani (strain ATCC BAA-1034 / DSM 16646 / JW/IW-1228P) TaxID=555079 RepID=D9S0A9_THEOJ|nr:NAD(P)/FAD-dependent oxidoreductase [Thermosediminibacter oceani]ADL07037.1 fumarate reductase/succinate dehydrogenase flavoprotein domain protein [Thermosediminibacter oceani DSM 16646]